MASPPPSLLRICWGSVRVGRGCYSGAARLGIPSTCGRTELEHGPWYRSVSVYNLFSCKPEITLDLLAGSESLFHRGKKPL